MVLFISINIYNTLFVILQAIPGGAIFAYVYSQTNLNCNFITFHIKFLIWYCWDVIKIYIEKYYLFNIFIVISDKLLINKITSYFCCIRVPLPSKEDLVGLCNTICGSESLKIKDNEIEEIVKKSNGSIKNMKHLIEFSFLSGKYEKYEDPVDDKMKFLYKIMKKKSMTTIYIVRELLQELLIENIRPNLILKFLLNKYKKEYISEKISYEKFLHIIQILNKYSLRIATGLRPIINLESCIIEIIDFL